MKPVCSVLLIAAVFLSTFVPPSMCRPGDLHPFGRYDDYKNKLGELLLTAGTDKTTSLVNGGDRLGHTLRNASRSPPFSSPDTLEELLSFTKRSDHPISIDLTFHLLRNMIEMARLENQREQAGLNRKYLDEIGK